LEETTSYFASREGLSLGDDFSVQYMAFDSSIELLKQGKAGAIVMPEPNVTLVESLPDVYISLSYYDEWQKYHPDAAGYPQVGALVLSDWAETHPAQIDQFNRALAEAITALEQDPESAVEAVKSHYKLSSELLLKSLGRTRYALQAGDEMRRVVTDYYAEIEKPLDDTFNSFFYVSAK